MISTYLGYVSATKDMASTLARIAKQATVKSDQQYYDAHIGKIKNVDEFLSDYKLYSYAMKAYGLEDMTYAKAFMKKVLTSDLSDTSSFANKLTDSRYRQFAAAFNFGGTSKINRLRAIHRRAIRSGSMSNPSPMKRPWPRRKASSTIAGSIRCRTSTTSLTAAE